MHTVVSIILISINFGGFNENHSSTDPKTVANYPINTNVSTNCTLTNIYFSGSTGKQNL